MKLLKYVEAVAKADGIKSYLYFNNIVKIKRRKSTWHLISKNNKNRRFFEYDSASSFSRDFGGRRRIFRCGYRKQGNI